MRQMISAQRNLTHFARNVWLTLGMFLVFSVSFFIYVYTEKQIDRANEVRLQSHLLAEELRRSSDDLTRMVRSYVVTGDVTFKRHYQEILDIRDGRKPRPVDYQNVYWDLVAGDGARPRPFGESVALLVLMRAAGFPPEELAKLAEAKANSDKLTGTEFDAMTLIETTRPLSDKVHHIAIAMLYDTAYHEAKAGIMRPIAEFKQMSDLRTLAAVKAAQSQAFAMRIAFLVFGLVLLSMLWGLRLSLRAILGGSVHTLHMHIARLGRGDFACPVPVLPGQEDSVLGWLAETQGKLANIESQRVHAVTRSQRLTQLYAALSHCNQAIVRCGSEAELLDQICRVVVLFGGMRLAWIGEADAARRKLSVVSAFGNGIAYLDGLPHALTADDPLGCGPTGVAFRSDQPVWCQDFQQDPSTAPWHERGAIYGWAASAALPLHRDGVVVAIFNLYADTKDAFDDDVRKLLCEMATDIDFALKGFAREAQREQAELALRESEQRMRTIVDTEPECVTVTDSQGLLLQVNAAGLAMMEAQSLEQVRHFRLVNFVLPEYRKRVEELQRKVLQGESGIWEFEIQGLNGTRRWLETHAAPMRDTQGNISMLLGITRDITAQKNAEARIQYLAHFDALTGLPNRSQLDDRANYALSLAQRSHEEVALMFLDVDHFKDINDTLGHSVGDALLIELAHRLRMSLREEDTVSRLGGDEFIFLFHGVDAHSAAHLAQKLLDVIATPFRIEQYDLNVSGSIGIALYPADGLDLETLSKNADAAMYRAKQEGRNGYCFFTAEMQARSSRHLQLVNALRHALEREELEVHYQPQVTMPDGQIVGAEALLRWSNPELGRVSPAEFIPAAEDSGLILPIGEWVLRQAVRQAKSWLEEGMVPLVMSVNLSAVQFRHPDLPKLVTRILEEEGLPPEYLELELTEGVAMHDPQAAIAVMNKLHGLGVRMSIDDFGTGYSSLSHLKKFKVYKLKIDQSFVRDISTDPEDKAIVGAIIHMAKSLGLQTIAEGVETPGQLAFLREQGCDEVQGYYYSKPLPAEQFAVYARERAST